MKKKIVCNRIKTLKKKKNSHDFVPLCQTEWKNVFWKYIRVECPADWFNTNHVLVVKYKLQVRVCWLALTSAVGAHSPILGGAAWPSVWHHHCPPISCGDVQRAPRRLGSTPWEEGGAGTAWRRKWHFLFDLFLTCLLSKICSQLDKIIINYIKYSYGHTHTPLSVQRHGRRLQVWIFHGLHLWAGQEVVERSEGVRGPGYCRLIGWAGGADGGAGAAQTLHVVHRSRHQITCRETSSITWMSSWTEPYCCH